MSELALGLALASGTLSFLALGPQSQAESAPKKPENVVDVTAVRDKLIVLTDGKQHFVAVNPDRPADERNDFFYGDGKAFFLLSQASYSRNGADWERSFHDPRLTDGGHEEGMGFVSFRGGKQQLQCGTRTTELKPLDAAAAKAMLDAATFQRSPRKYRPYALARDDRGNYYYVDRGYHTEDKQKFRLFAGPKGNLKQQKMTNVVSDSQGDIFATKTGSLRFVLNRDPKESQWIAGAGKKESRSNLVMVPVDFNRNVASVYNEFGIYAGERLGTPCDDL